MQIALITAGPEPVDTTERSPGAMLLAGRSILQHQLDFALRAGCERVICLAEHMPADIDILREACTRKRAHLRLLLRPRELSALIPAQSCVLVIGPNVLVDRAMCSRLTADRSLILTLPADQAVMHGFERIDATRAWAGAMKVPGRLIEELYKLPPDIDVASALLRLALIDGTTMVELPLDALSHRGVALASDAPAMRRIEQDRIARACRPVSYAAPLRAIAERLAIRHAARRLASPVNSTLPLLAGGGLALLALFAAKSGYVSPALLALLLAYSMLTAWTLLRRVSYQDSSSRLPGIANDALDLVLVIVLALGSGAAAGSLTGWFAPLTLIALLQIAPIHLRGRLLDLANDRMSLIALLVLGHVLNLLSTSVMLMSLLLAGLFVYGTRWKQITTD